MSGWISPAWIACISTGYVVKLKLQTAGGVIYFFHDHRGKPIASPTLFEPIGEKFRRDIMDWARANGIPMIRFGPGDRKADVMAPYLVGAVDAAGGDLAHPGLRRRRSCPRVLRGAAVENMGLGRPENVELLFRHGQRSGRPSGPPPGGGFKTKIDRYCDLVTLNVFYKSSRVKQYLKNGVALRIETVVNSPLTCAATG